MEIISNSPEKTAEIGYIIGKTLSKNCVISLNGDMGAGKTTLIKGIAKSIGLNPDDILSPYFNIVFEYSKDSEVLMYHFDFMRLNDVSELYELNIPEILDSESLVVMEWADKFPEILPSKAITIHIDDTSPYQRVIHINSENETLIEQLKGALEL